MATPIVTDYRDIMIRELAAGEAAWAARALRAERERDAYQLIAQTWAHCGRQSYLEHERLKAQHVRLIDEYRALRAQVMHTHNVTDAKVAA